MTDFAGFFESVGEADFAMGWLTAVFGPALGSGEHTAISAAAATLNAALLIIGASAVAWHTLLGIVNTAHEGKVLGQQWHQIWAPVRVAVGIAMLAPIPSYGGFGGAQIAVLQLAQWGVGLADTIWSGAAARIAAGGDVSAVALPNSRELMHSLVRMQTCRHAVLEASPGVLRETLAKPMMGSGTPYLPEEPLTSKEEIKGGLINRTVETVRYKWEMGVCGGVVIDVAASQPAPDALVTVADKGRIAAAQVGAIESMLAVADGLGAAIVAASLDGEQAFPSASVVEQAVKEYDTAMQEAAKQAASAATTKARTNFASKAAEGGWTAAGSWYMTVASIAGDTVRAASVMPNVRPPRLADKHAWHVGTGGVKAAEDALTTANRWWTDRVEYRGVGTPEDVEGGGADGIWAKLADVISVGKMKGIYDAAALDPADPLGGMVRMGHNALWVAEAMFAAGAAAWTVGGSIVGDVVGASGGLSFLLPIAQTIIMGIMAVGVMHAYVLPMLPYIMHTLAVFAWFIFVCEAVVAAPIWALIHVRFDGQDLIDQAQRPGYVLAFNLFLRPALITLGMLMALSVLGVFAGFVNQTFFAAMRGATDGHITGVVGLLAMLGILTYLHWQLAVRSFALITLVPDRVARWFGAGAESMGETGDVDKQVAMIATGTSKAEHTKPRMSSTRPGAPDSPASDEGNGGSGAGSRRNGGEGLL